MILEGLRKAREGKGWTREELAIQIGLDAQAVKRLENGSGSVATLLHAMRATEFHIAGLARGSTVIEQMVARRLNIGMTAAELSRRAGISRQTLAKLDKGEGTVAPLVKVLSILAPKAQAAKPTRASWNHDRRTDRDKRFTPAWFLQHVVDSFGPIDLDPCAHELSSVKAKRSIGLPEDGLKSSWAGTQLAFVNPPFSHLVGWLHRAVDAFESGECEKIVILIPTRTDSGAFHDRVVPLADIALLRGRLRFDTPEGLKYHAPFSMMVCIFGGEHREISRFAELVPATWLMRVRSVKVAKHLTGPTGSAHNQA